MEDDKWAALAVRQLISRCAMRAADALYWLRELGEMLGD